jgi:hypothetical protein
MGCCDKVPIAELPRFMAHKARNIAVGYKNLAQGKINALVVHRMRACMKCDKLQFFIRGKTKRIPYCKICKCYIPAKARVEEERCPEKKW